MSLAQSPARGQNTPGSMFYNSRAGPSARAIHRAAVFACLATISLRPLTAAEGSRPISVKPGPRVLLLSSFGREFSYFSQVLTDFRSDLDHLTPDPCDFYEVDLELARFDSEARQEPFVEYLNAIFEARRPQLVVTFGGPAARFTQLYRHRLFSDVPVLYGAVNPLHVAPAKFGDLDSVLPVENDLASVPETALRLLPDLQHLAIILGSSPLERIWKEKISQEFAPFEPRLHLLWLNGLNLEAVTAKVASLPPHSAVFLVMLLVDEAGAAYPQDRVLTAVHAAARGPVFGIFDNQIGAGVVGGRSTPMRQVSRQTAEAAARLLAGANPIEVRLPPIQPKSSVFDGRELARWNIPESRLPAGAEVRFRADSPWSQYRMPILAGSAALMLQGMLIVGLLVQRARRREAEHEVSLLHGRLLTAYEQERRRLARELHDDVTQRLARLAIDAAQLERQRPGSGGNTSLRQMREELVRLSDDVHTLSRQLHPSILDDLGLTDALRSEGERFARGERIAVDLQLGATPPGLSADKALSLFRVAQEALRNIARHARARRVELALRHVGAGVELAVSDDGVGFDVQRWQQGPGLGHISMRERLNLVGGRLEIASAPGRGTRLLARVPLDGAAS